jgi:multidrug efflux pump subunit AcrA (membrane-fusion protein)
MLMWRQAQVTRMKNPMTLTLLSSLFLISALLSGCREQAAPPAAQPRTVLVYTVALGEGFNQAEYSGEVKPRHETALAFRVGGKLLTRQVDVGDRVAAGQLLARLDAADLALSSSGADANRAAAAAERTFARA